MEVQTKTNHQTKIKWVVDVIIFVAFLVAMDPHSSGVAVHEWLTTAALAAIAVHLLLSWDWVVQVTRRFTGKVNGLTRVNYVLNWLLFVDVMVVMLSGFMISEAVMPFLGISLPENFTWRTLHHLSADVFMPLLGLHTALHWNWLVKAFKRYVLNPIAGILPARKEKDVIA